jgi:hypothetical protein
MKVWQYLAIGGVAWILLRSKSAQASGRSGGSQTVLDVARAIPDGGISRITGTGVPFDIVHKGTSILAKGATVYCSGFTFAAVMRAAERRGLLAQKTVEQIRRFQREWYGGEGDTERQQGPAMRNLDIGKPVSHDEAVPGDFVQYWRQTSGHSVVFLGWLLDAGNKKIGLKYRSVDSKGVGDSREKFSDSGGAINRARVYFSRLA